MLTYLNVCITYPLCTSSVCLTIRSSPFAYAVIFEALPGVLGNRGKRYLFQGNKGQILRGTWEQRQYWGAGNIRKHIFDFWGTGEQANLFQGNKGTGTPPPWEGLIFNGCIKCWTSWPYVNVYHRTIPYSQRV